MKKQYRVKKSNEIEKILNTGRYAYDSYFTVYKINNPQTINFRYAISVGKKLGNAVLRNRIKRQIRAIIDSFDINLNNNVDVFIIAKRNVVSIDFNTMKSSLENLLKKQKLIKGEKND